MSDNLFNIDFQRQFVCLMIGAPIAIFAGLVINSLWQHAKSSIERNQLLKMLAKATEHNIWLLGRIDEEMEKGIPTFNVNTVSFEASMAKRYELFEDVSLSHDIDIAQFELAHLKRKIDFAASVVFDSYSRRAIERNGKLTSHFEETFPQLKNSIQRGTDTTRKLLDALLVRLRDTQANTEL